MITVTGGTLPAGSALVGQSVASFEIGKYEVTWGEWKAVRDWAATNNKGYDLAGVGGTYPNGSADNFPVINVSWYDVVKWSNAKSEMEGLTPVYTLNGTTYKAGQSAPTMNASANGYRLPSEKEWEWAARGGVSGVSHNYVYSGSNTASNVAWLNENSSSGTKAVGTKLANELGIYDMTGNAWEWCEDVAYTFYRRFRGGGWNFNTEGAAVADPGNTEYPDVRYYDGGIGFRLARNIDYSEMITVAGGTLPAGSELVGQSVASFEIGKYEVTWGEWKAVRDWAATNNKGYDLAGVGNTYPSGSADNFPVINVSWYDVVKWCNAKSEKENKTPVYKVNGATYKTGVEVPTLNASANGYRLPSEKEWEWAARGGVSSQGYTYSGSNTASDVAWTYENSSLGTKAVGTKSANELGIYDMSGNVWEWCEDVAYTSSRRIRGGSWNFYGAATVAYRDDYYYPGYRSYIIGFRLGRSSGN